MSYLTKQIDGNICKIYCGEKLQAAKYEDLEKLELFFPSVGIITQAKTSTGHFFDSPAQNGKRIRYSVFLNAKTIFERMEKNCLVKNLWGNKRSVLWDECPRCSLGIYDRFDEKGNPVCNYCETEYDYD